MGDHPHAELLYFPPPPPPPAPLSPVEGSEPTPSVPVGPSPGAGPVASDPAGGPVGAGLFGVSISGLVCVGPPKHQVQHRRPTSMPPGPLGVNWVGARSQRHLIALALPRGAYGPQGSTRPPKRIGGCVPYAPPPRSPLRP